MGFVDQGRLLNKYNLGQRRKEGFLSNSRKNLKTEQRIGRKKERTNKVSANVSYRSRKLRKGDLFKVGFIFTLGIILFVILITCGAVWVLS